MNSSLIGKVEKARRYAQERDRIAFTSFEVKFHGENDDHMVSMHNNKLHCNCDFYATWSSCSHTMALERILDPMLSHDELAV
ncbi:MAG: hypothetical protein NTZ05_06960 [Chloroflexi bacterium]|nr:hypothetical protein [Chloroflexota bacterium]